MKRVYVFEMESGVVKIGVSQDIAQRMRQVSYNYKEKVINSHYTEFAPNDVAAKIERVCHDEFADQRLNGEYFNITFAEACIELDNYADEIKAANIGISNISKQDDMIDDTTIKCNFRTSSERFQKEFDLKNNNPNAKTLFKLAKTFNVSADYLLGLTDDPRPVDEILATQNTQAPTPVSPSDIEKRFDELSAMLTEHNARLSALESAQVAQA